MCRCARQRRQIGCVYSWASYLEGDDDERVFGLDRRGLEAVCTNPASPGGEGVLDAYFRGRDFAPADGHPFAEVNGQLAASCERDGQGAVLRIKILPGPYADALRSVLSAAGAAGAHRADWGLHRHDVDLALGSILRLIDVETVSWLRDHPGASP